MNHGSEGSVTLIETSSTVIALKRTGDLVDTMQRKTAWNKLFINHADQEPIHVYWS